MQSGHDGELLANFMSHKQMVSILLTQVYSIFFFLAILVCFVTYHDSDKPPTSKNTTESTEGIAYMVNMS